jgi:uncharacterized OB-fold protein
MTYEKPLPVLNADNKEFWESCKNHQLRIQKCHDCGELRWPPSFLCPHCHAQDSEWVQVSGKGTVYTFTIFHRAYHLGFKEDIPYVTAVIELDEGPHLLSNIVDCEPGEVRCDMPVEVVWADIDEDFSIPKFKPA